MENSPPGTESDPADPVVEQPVPVRLMFHPDPSGASVAASLRNNSDKSLDITITASNPVTGNQSSAQLTLAPHGNADLTQSGLIIGHGDDVTITSASYADRQMHAN